MGLNITVPRRTITTVHYELVYDYASDPGCGYRFDCDEQGNPIGLSDIGLANLNDAKSGKDPGLKFRGLQRRESHYRAPAEGKCSCGRTVYLDDPLDNECECGMNYNMSGQSVCNSREAEEPYYDDY